MPLINQNDDSSQKKTFQWDLVNAIATGVTAILGIIQYDSLLQGVNVAAFGLSGSPVWSLELLRFVGGQTLIPIGSTLTVQAYGTSGAIGFSIAPPGVSLLAGDVVLLHTGAANTAVANSLISVVTSGIADIKVYQNAVA